MVNIEKTLSFRIIVKGEGEKTMALNKLQVELKQTTDRIKELIIIPDYKTARKLDKSPKRMVKWLWNLERIFLIYKYGLK
jgi:hypothetical protein